MPIPAVELVNAPKAEEAAETGLSVVIERLAINPAVDVVKLEKIIELQERMIGHSARAEYYAAFATMQGELPEVTERGQIAVNGQVRSNYAKNEDIQATIRPILQKHGFALSFRNTFKDGYVTITGILSHRSGHAEQDEFVAKADDSGSKNAIQALGSTRSYGQRYTTISLLNIVTRGQDDDGRDAERSALPEAPKGYAAWLDSMQDVADEGIAKLEAGWKAAHPSFRAYVARHDAKRWAVVKAKAASCG